ncbi:MAG TPA: DUF4339 domain-containing protein [Prosthecobacter sp.]|nr:DUF4339 domain-containing protein [Prosthecobacter sp.]
MNWYFDNEGVADGPHDEDAMKVFAVAGQVGPQTLVWQPSMSGWQEAVALKVTWLRPAQPPVKEVAPLPVPVPRTATGVLNPDTTRRVPVPSAPTGALTPGRKPGFFRRLFGFGRKKGNQA